MGLLVRVRRPVELFDMMGKANRRADRGHTLMFPRCARCKRTEYDEGGLPVERQKYVDEVGLVEFSADRTYARVRGKCHGQEQVLEVKFPYALDTDEDEEDMALWRSLWRSLVFFDTEFER